MSDNEKKKKMLDEETEKEIKEKIESSINENEYENKKKELCIFISALIITIIYVLFNYYGFRTLNLYENTLYSNNVSYPFIDLSIEIDPDYNVTVYIAYERKGQLKIATITNNNSIDMDCIKKELKVSELKPEKEFQDSLSFYFSIKNSIKNTKAAIKIWNKMYDFDPSIDLNNAKEYRRGMFYYIENELLLSIKANELKVYEYYILSYSIKTLNNTYTFPVISNNEKIRYLAKELKKNIGDYNFAVNLVKLNYLKSIELKGNSFEKIFRNSYGTISSGLNLIAIILFIIYFCRKYGCKICPKICDKRKKNSLTNNEVNPNNINIRELNDLNNGNVTS